MADRSSPPPSRRRSRIQFPPELPISQRVPDIIAALSNHQVLIVVGATGSGKTTQLPKIALSMGRGGKARIGVTQPRRIAATAVAARVARELSCDLGQEVGYQIRFEDRTCQNTWVKFMTDGVLLAEIQGDRLLRGYDTLIIDEAHERSLTIDFLLGWLKRILPQRPDLKVIVSSATIESERFSEFFAGAPVVQVEGRTFPVDVWYEPPPAELDGAEAVANAVENLTALDPRGSILVFLPGEREIREAEQALGRKALRHTKVWPLYSRLSASDQTRVFSSIPERRVILATNVAETSLTIPGIVYVVDTGVARLSRYDPRTGITRLQIEAISQASANQRRGRCGRVEAGVCLRLYDEQSFMARPEYTDPEIKRTGMAGIILRMKALGLGEVDEFPFLDPPHGRSVAEGMRVLEELGALDTAGELTALGRRLARFPVDPRIGRMILAGIAGGCLPDVLTVAAGLSVPDPRERPRGSEAKADQAHQRFRVEESDFLGLLRLWEYVRENESKGTSQLRRACKESFLSFVRIREWGELRRQLEEMVRQVGESAPEGSSSSERASKKQKSHDSLHCALLSGLLSRVGQWDSLSRAYLGARQTRFVIHPSSGLAKKPPQWLMAFELVETTQLFARTVARVDPTWLAKVGSHLLRRSYSDPHWSEKSGRASVREHATLFGLPVLKDHSVDYATISPSGARRMFLEHALVRQEYQSHGAFQEKNRRLLAELSRLRDKARQSDMLMDEAGMLAFFESRVPGHVVNGKTFEVWRKLAEHDNPECLCFDVRDVLAEELCLDPDAYPDTVVVHGVKLSAQYRFEPGAPDDGVTLEVPIALLPQLAQGELEWTIPAWHEQKIAALLAELPRAVRRELGNTSLLATRLAPLLTPFSGPLLPTLSAALHAAAGIDVPAESFRPSAIAPHLSFNCRIIGEHGALVAEGRDVSLLVEKFAAQARDVLSAAAPPGRWARSGIVTWDVGDLPPYVCRVVQGVELRGYPALRDRRVSVELCLLESEQAAAVEHRAGVRRLLAIAAQVALSAFGKRVPPPSIRGRKMPPTRAECEAFRELVLARVVDESFGLGEASLPRSKSAFDQVLARGTSQIPKVFERFVRIISMVSSEYDKVLRALEGVAKVPSGAHAAADIRSQLQHLVPADFLARTSLLQLEQLPRYLRAAQIRLGRAVVDPQKDMKKAEPLLPVWKVFMAKQVNVVDRLAADQVRFAFEELRVHLFAPELGVSRPVTVAGITAAVAALR